MRYDVNALACFNISVTLGVPFNSSLASRLGAALANDTSPSVVELCRLLAAEPHGETSFCKSVYASVSHDQHWLSVAAGVR